MKVRFSSAVRTALRRRQAVVALESSVVAQGLPKPHNLQVAIACEQAVSDAGAVPATIAVVEGVVTVGLSRSELELLASGAKALRKLGERDLAVAMAEGASGGTTVSGTLAVAAHVGIRVFATGGLGGVHRGWAQSLDVSQDLSALSRHRVAVVCAGMKTVLDVPATMEWLETLGVPVVGWGTSELPGFYCSSTEIGLESSIDSAKDAARICHARYRVLRQDGAVVFVVPPPARWALSEARVERALRGALRKAKAHRVTGKGVTPFLLRELVERTQGASLAVNRALLIQNASRAGQLAVELGRAPWKGR